jgi:IclR family acetate operon transcriptional repressor
VAKDTAMGGAVAALVSDSPDYGIAALDRAFDVIAAIMHGGPATLAVIADGAACNRATAFRILHTLQSRGFVAQDQPRGPWRLGASCISVGRAALGQRAQELAAAPAMAALAASCHEGVYLAARDGQEAEILLVQPGEKQVRVYAQRGDRAPLHAGPGRLLLAFAPVAIQRAVLAQPRLARLGSRTKTDAASVAAELPKLVSRGWLITEDEIEDGAATVSLPVRDSSGAVLAVLSIIGPKLRLPGLRQHGLLTPLMEAAGAVGAAIGVLP